MVSEQHGAGFDDNARVHFSYLQLGPLRLPILGIFAALGLMAALALSQRTARWANLSPESVWNAGITAIVAVFVVSRLLLLAFNFQSFLKYPLLVLALPSVTGAGILLAALFMLSYIRWRRLPLMPLLDATAPCVCVLWAFLSLGRVIDGTHDGMPTHLWRSFRSEVHPVELYTLCAAAIICLFLVFTFRTGTRTGQTGAAALILSGVTLFFLDFFRLPSELLANSWLDPSQIIGIAMLLTGALLLVRVEAKRPATARSEGHHAI